jgi:hypothetical protein
VRPHSKRWTGAYVGWVGARKSANQGADGVLQSGTQQRDVRKRECPAAPRARTERPGHCPGWKAADRWEKAMSYKAHRHG